MLTAETMQTTLKPIRLDSLKELEDMHEPGFTPGLKTLLVDFIATHYPYKFPMKMIVTRQPENDRWTNMPIYHIRIFDVRDQEVYAGNING